jgi:hypothetical protein
MANDSIKKNWTVMVYLAGDNNLDGAGLVDLTEMKSVGSTAHVNIIAQFDRAGASQHTQRYYLRRASTLEQDVVANLGETNTGDPAVLESFAKWGIANYPAEKYMLVLWNHGSGWDDTNVYRAAHALNLEVGRKGKPVLAAQGAQAGVMTTQQARRISERRFHRALFRTTVEDAMQARAIAFDDNAQDFLDNLETKRVLGAIQKSLGQKMDVLGLDACLMSMAEVAYQVRGQVTHTVGSEQLEPADGWPYDAILGDLAAKPSMSPREFSALIVKKYIASYVKGEDVTQSAFDLAHSQALASAISGLGVALMAGIGSSAVFSAVVLARTQVQRFATEDYVDLADLCRLIRTKVKQARITSACDAVLDAARQFVVANGSKGASLKRAKGLSIYFPMRFISPLYAKLDFAKNTQWDEFLRAYVRAVARA